MVAAAAAVATTHPTPVIVFALVSFAFFALGDGGIFFLSLDRGSVGVSGGIAGGSWGRVRRPSAIHLWPAHGAAPATLDHRLIVPPVATSRRP